MLEIQSAIPNRTLFSKCVLFPKSRLNLRRKKATETSAICKGGADICAKGSGLIGVELHGEKNTTFGNGIIRKDASGKDSEAFN